MEKGAGPILDLLQLLDGFGSDEEKPLIERFEAGDGRIELVDEIEIRGHCALQTGLPVGELGLPGPR